MEGQSAILDLLFDKSEGILKEDIPSGLEPLDFSNLDLMTADFDDFLFDGALLCEEKKVAPQISTYTDHDYVMQPVTSPASSDSGVSVESGNLSPRNANEDTVTQSGLDTHSMSGSPSSVSQFSPHMLGRSPDMNSSSGDGLSHSPATENHIGLDALEFENFDFGDMNFDTLDTNALADDSNADSSMLDEDVSIDLGNHSDLMTFGTTTNVTHNADGTETKTIKIIKVSAAETLPFTMKDVSTDTQRPGSFPELRLTEEEKDLLAREGIALPTNMPLTKEEERQLKAIRRKIRNKISAKESRKRKMDYVEGLEKRVKMCTHENQTLVKKVESLEKKNMTLINQLKKLQSFINLRSTKTAQASTCVMVLLLSFAFLVVPNFNPMGGDDSLEDLKSIPLPGKSRNLLHDAGDLPPSDTDNPYGITMRPAPFWEYPSKTPAVQEANTESTAKGGDEIIDNIDIDVVGVDSVESDSKRKTENIIYVQIEKDPEIMEESNVTYVFSEEEYKKDSQQPRPSGVKQEVVEEKTPAKSRKQDL